MSASGLIYLYDVTPPVAESISKAPLEINALKGHKVKVSCGMNHIAILSQGILILSNNKS